MGDSRFEFDKLIHKGKVAELHSVGVRMPDGEVVQRDFVHYGGAAVVLPIMDDGSVVMIRNYRFAVAENLLELPAGMMDGDEEPRATAARELAEETGFTAGRLEPLGEFYTGPGTTDERMFAFLATELTKGRQSLEPHEQIRVEVHAADEVRRMVADGTIHDGKSIAALALYWLRTGVV